jgi:hypothetical protein
VWNTYKIWIDSTFTGEFDGLAQIRRALDAVPGVLAGYNSDDQEVHIHAAPIHSVRRHG